MRTIGEVYAASPLLLLDTNCLLIRVLFALHGGDSTESQLLPQTQTQVPVQIFQQWKRPSNQPAQSLSTSSSAKTHATNPKQRPIYDLHISQSRLMLG